MRRPLMVVTSIVFSLAAFSAPAESAEPFVRATPREGTVALTFDDGPHPRWTPVILDILDEYGVEATFFVAGFRVDSHPEIAAEIVARGHSIQNHTFGHEDLTRLGNRFVRWTLDEGRRAIAAATGAVPSCVRPPFGSVSNRVRRIISEQRLEVVMWDINTRDYAHGSVAAALSYARRAQPGDIILMHDTLGYLWVEALPKLIEELQSRGIGFDTLCERPEPRPETLRLPAFLLRLF